MKKVITVFILIACVILTSCVTSLYPITENENDLVFKKELLGKWVDKDSTEYIVDQDGGTGKAYRATIIESKKNSGSGNFSDTSCFILRLVSVRDRLFLDCTPDMQKFQSKDLGESAVSAVVPTHFIIRVISIKQSAVELAPLDHDKLLTLLQQGKFKMKNELLNKDDVLFTEKPKNLQQKLIELSEFPTVFNSSTLNRTTNGGR